MARQIPSYRRVAHSASPHPVSHGTISIGKACSGYEVRKYERTSCMLLFQRDVSQSASDGSVLRMSNLAAKNTSCLPRTRAKRLIGPLAQSCKVQVRTKCLRTKQDTQSNSQEPRAWLLAIGARALGRRDFSASPRLLSPPVMRRWSEGAVLAPSAAAKTRPAGPTPDSARTSSWLPDTLPDTLPDILPDILPPITFSPPPLRHLSACTPSSPSRPPSSCAKTSCQAASGGS